VRLGPEATQQLRLFVRIMQTVLGALLFGLLLGVLLNRLLGISMSWSAAFMFVGLGLGIYSIYRADQNLKGSMRE